MSVVWHGIRDALLMAWEVWWALVIGFAISAIVQAWVPRERVQRALGEGGPAAWEDDGFGVHFAFFGQTRADVRLRILEGRRSRLEERMEAIRAAFTRTRERVDRYTLELQRHGLESVEREVRWLNELIASERQASGPDNISEKESS